MKVDEALRWATEVVLALAVVTLPLCLGGAPDWTGLLLSAFAITALATFVVSVFARRAKRSRGPAHLSSSEPAPLEVRAYSPSKWLLALAVVLIATAALQLVPLPPLLQALLSPRAAELREFALVPLGDSSWRPSTLDAPSTFRALSRLLSLTALAFVAAHASTERSARRHLLAVVAGLGLCVSLVGLLHFATGAEAFLGTYHFTASLPLLTPFGNTNHLAGFLLLPGVIAIGLSMTSPSRDSQVGWLVAASFIAVAVFFSMSRGGIASFLVTLGLVAGTLVAPRAGGMRRLAPFFAVGVVLLIAGALALEPVLERLSTVSTVEKLHHTKLELWPMMWAGALNYWRLGMGAGAYELAFSREQTTQLDVTFTHPENIWLQYASEFGLPVFVVATALLLVGLFFAWRATARHELERVALVGLAGLLLHEVVDFSLELNGVATVAAVVLGVVAFRAGHTTMRRARLLGLGVVWGLAGLLTAWLGLPTHRSAEAKLEHVEKTPELRVAVIDTIKRHPADWVPYSLMAHRAAADGDARESLAWVNRLLFVRPADPKAHVAAATALYRMGNLPQAQGELRLAFMANDGSALAFGVALAKKTGRWDRLLTGKPGFLTQVIAFVAPKSLTDARAIVTAAEEALPAEPEVLLEAKRASVQLELLAKDGAKALVALDALPADEQERDEHVLERAQAFELLGRGGDARAALEVATKRSPGNLTLAVRLIAVLQGQGAHATAREVIGRALPFASKPSARAELFLHEADSLVAEGQSAKAVSSVETATRLQPMRADLVYRLASLHESRGAFGQALEAVKRGRAIDSPTGSAAQAEWVERLEAKVKEKTGAD